MALIRKISILFILTCLMISCKSYDGDDRKDSTAAVSGDKILFVGLAFSIDKISKEYKVAIEKSELVYGRLKDPYRADTVPAPDYLLVRVLDKDKNLLKSIVMEDPLYRSMEYVGDDQEFKRKLVQSESGNLMLRLQYHSGISYIEINKIDKDLKYSKITVLEILLDND